MKKIRIAKFAALIIAISLAFMSFIPLSKEAPKAQQVCWDITASSNFWYGVTSAAYQASMLQLGYTGVTIGNSQCCGGDFCPQICGKVCGYAPGNPPLQAKYTTLSEVISYDKEDANLLNAVIEKCNAIGEKHGIVTSVSHTKTECVINYQAPK